MIDLMTYEARDLCSYLLVTENNGELIFRFKQALGTLAF